MGPQCLLDRPRQPQAARRVGLRGCPQLPRAPQGSTLEPRDERARRAGPRALLPTKTPDPTPTPGASALFLPLAKEPSSAVTRILAA